MHPSSFLLALTAAIGVGANPRINTKLPDRVTVGPYLESLVPVALDVLRNDIGGPSIGADVSPHLIRHYVTMTDANIALLARCPYNPHS
jgi:hypothetical protein